MNDYETPYERATRLGLRSVTAIDLLALGIASDPDDATAREPICRDWLRRFAIKGFVDQSVVDVMEYTSLPPFEATRFLAAVELGRRAGAAAKGSVDVISRPEDVAQIFEWMRDETKEHVCALYLDSKNQVLAHRTIHIGTANASVLGPREVLREAVRVGAVGFIVVHNHPSGDPTPSPEDIEVTKKLREAGKMLDVLLLDHVIIGHHRHVSLKALGLT
ncbi:MAG TPA: DNA repair protein RadC [Fimbriimonadaceae bacterium]|nr:DNA repair protein RadC [Fimbriimonadaceae bacterium]HRJ32552.1 DNA repair protein RadC [Fimbriimonadaceae bacterium]